MERLLGNEKTAGGIALYGIDFTNGLEKLSQTIYYLVVEVDENGKRAKIVRAQEAGTFDSVEVLLMQDLASIPAAQRKIIGAGHITVAGNGDSLLGSISCSETFLHGHFLEDQRPAITKGLQELLGHKLSIV